MKSNTLYYTKDYVQGKLIDEDGDITINDFNTIEFNPKKLVDLINKSLGELGHKCITTYRHAFIYEDVVYNLCLSCGDVLIDGEHYYLKDKKIINEFVNKIIMEEEQEYRDSYFEELGVTNIVEQSQLDEMVNLFLSFSLAKKEEILNNLRNG